LRRALLGLAIALFGLGALGCQPSASFQPEGACLADGRAPGTYPELEAKVPGSLGEHGSTTRDSGRSCSDERLGTLMSHGVTDLRYAGATWGGEGSQSDVVAVFTTPPGTPTLEAAWVEEFYQAGAQASTKTENITVTEPTMPDAGRVWRLDTLNDLSFQSVVVWPGDGLVHVVIVATRLEPGGLTRADHDSEVGSAVHWAAVPGSA
jgi:hypothetical protein